ncbi:MAG: DUF58 domain-containing protein [Pseudomonadota bacterium]
MTEDHLLAARLAADHGPLRLKAPRRRRLATHGAHMKRRAGSGADFWQYRALAPGEAATRIDWRRSSRSDDLYVREREREDTARLILDLDGSPSMRFSSSAEIPEKWQRGRVLLTAIAEAALSGGEAVSIPSRGALRRGADAWDALAETVTDLDARAGDTVIVASDFLRSDMKDVPERLASQGAACMMLLIIDPAEAEFPFAGRVRFLPVASGTDPRDMQRAEQARDEYLAAWQAHCDELRDRAKQADAPLLSIRTDDVVVDQYRRLRAVLAGENAA